MYVVDKLQRFFDGSSDNPAIDYFLKALDAEKVIFYNKVGDVQAAKALVETRVVTIIDGEQETVNTAKPGDYIVTGARGEKYVLAPEKFENRYKHKGGNVWSATGGCYAVQYEGPTIAFKAPWGEDMICNDQDYICSTVLTGDDVYRIERLAFLETYRSSNYRKTTDLNEEPSVPKGVTSETT